MDENLKKPITAKKRTVLKLGLISMIVIVMVTMVYIVLPDYLGIQTAEKHVFTGYPTYTCENPYEIASCNNKTAIDGYFWVDGGLQVLDVKFEFDP